MKRKLQAALLSAIMCAQLVLPSVPAQAATTLYNNDTGTQDGYNYELWKDYGDTSMTLNSGGTFSCYWDKIGNALFRKGVKFDSTKTYKEIGNISVDYGCDYQPNGNSYLCVYGWTTEPLVEYYIVDSWGSWRPPGASSKGTITVDGGTYDVYETTRVNQPSIQGNTTFQQYWSVRTSKRTSGTISVSDHFRAWENMGMKAGKLYEAALNVEGYQSSGWADVYKNTFTVGGSGSSNNNGGYNNNNNNNNQNQNAGNNLVTVDDKDKLQCENMTKGGQYTGNVNSPFSGVALYGNNDSVSFTQNFKSGTHDFTLRGCSNNDNMARVDLVIGGQTKGTFYFGDANPAEYTIKNVSHGTGNQKVELVVTADDGQWDAYIDYLAIGGISSEGNNNGGNNNQNNNNNTGNNNQNQNNNTGNNNQSSASGTTVQCEDMTLGGQYTGKISTPFNGVALYANNDSVKYTQYFSNGTHDFTLRGCSNNDNMARVDLKIGGETKGTFYFGDANTAEYTIKNVTHGTGNQTIELVVTADDGQWDAYLDSLIIGGQTGSNNAGNTNTGNNNQNAGNTNQNTNQNQNNNTGNNNQTSTGSSVTTQCENMTTGGQYTGKISSPFNGVALYANNDSVKYTQNFTNGTHDFTLRGCSNNDNMARVDLKIGGQTKGTFYFGDANPANYTIKNVSHGTGNQTIELVVTADDGQWDAYIDSLTIDPANSTNNANGSDNNINASTKMVALTFDDGPSSTTPAVLDVLEKYDVVATFFLIGNQVNDSTKSIMQRQIDMGCELANHSYSHKDMSNMSTWEIQQEISKTSNAIKSAVNYDVKFFRPPYIGTSNRMYENINLPFIQGIMCNDWESSTSSYQRSSTVLNSVSDGSIILLHDFQGNTQTVDALPAIIEGLQNQGYTFVTVSQLFNYKGVNADVEYKIWSNAYDK